MVIGVPNVSTDEEKEADRITERLVSGKVDESELTAREWDILARSVGMTAEGLMGFHARCRRHGEIIRAEVGR